MLSSGVYRKWGRAFPGTWAAEFTVRIAREIEPPWAAFKVGLSGFWVELPLATAFYRTLGKSLNLQVPQLPEQRDSWSKMQFQNRSSMLIFLPFPSLDLILAVLSCAFRLTCLPVVLGGLVAHAGGMCNVHLAGWWLSWRWDRPGSPSTYRCAGLSSSVD